MKTKHYPELMKYLDLIGKVEPEILAVFIELLPALNREQINEKLDALAVYADLNEVADKITKF